MTRSHRLRRSNALRFAWSLPLALAALTAANRASASPSFPGTIQRELSMPCTPQCTICHTDNVGGVGTLGAAFGFAMKDAGLILTLDDTVAPALAELESEGTDSDEDGVPDVTELRAGQDPNGDLDLCSIEPPRYGCSSSPAQSPKSASTLFWVMLGGVALGTWLRRRGVAPSANEPASES